MEHENVAAVRAALEAFMKGDMETMSASLDENTVWHVPGDNRFAGTFTGRDAVVGRFAQMAEAGIRATLADIHDVVGNDDHVVALVQLSVSGPSGSATGRAVQVYHVRDGKAAEFWGYNEDQAAIDAILGS